MRKEQLDAPSEISLWQTCPWPLSQTIAAPQVCPQNQSLQSSVGCPAGQTAWLCLLNGFYCPVLTWEAGSVYNEYRSRHLSARKNVLTIFRTTLPSQTLNVILKFWTWFPRTCEPCSSFSWIPKLHLYRRITALLYFSFYMWNWYLPRVRPVFTIIQNAILVLRISSNRPRFQPKVLSTMFGSCQVYLVSRLFVVAGRLQTEVWVQPWIGNGCQTVHLRKLSEFPDLHLATRSGDFGTERHQRGLMLELQQGRLRKFRSRWWINISKILICRYFNVRCALSREAAQ